MLILRPPLLLFFFPSHSVIETHQLTETCWNKCVKSVNGSSLDTTEAGCLTNCVDRFMDVNNLTMKHLSSLRRS